MEERSTRIYRQKQMLSKEALQAHESLCIHEQPANCVAACPLKLDTKALVKSVAVGDFSGALALYEKITQFPHILSAGCEAPCKSKCKLCGVGDGIGISALERACVKYSTEQKKRSLLRFKKKKNVAVFGADLFSVALVGELSAKAYPLTFYCSESSAYEIISKCAPFLDVDGLGAESARLESLDVNIQYSSDLTPALLDENRGKFDIICASRDFLKLINGSASVDGTNLLCHELNIISASDAAAGVLYALFDAKRAAVSVDRIAQNMDPSSTRGEEGSIETRLYTSLKDVASSARIPENEAGYSAEEAKNEASRCIQCHCDECVKGCTYLEHYKKYPRLLTREIYNNVSIVMGDHMMNKPINSCALCGQCKITCPNGYDMADICLAARENMVTTEKMPLAPHEFALLDMMFSNGEAFLCRPQPGFEKCRYVFFPGCQASAIAPETVRRSYLDLTRRLDGGVALMLGCCGAIAHWAGRYELYNSTLESINTNLGELGNPVVIAGCPTCKKLLSENTNTLIVGIWDILKEIGLPDSAKPENITAVMHDSCGARGDSETQKAVRDIAAAMGIELIDTEYSGDKTACCGYGGLTMYANREVAHEMAEKCLSESSEPFITYCMSCRDRFAREGRRSKHILELVYGADAGDPPDISEKRYNRLTLKNNLLKQIWGEDAEEMYCDFTLEFTPEALAQMDDRMILKTDVISVIENLRKNGEAILDSETGLLNTRKRIGNVTFWVKYEETESGYVIRGAYSHRMRVE